MQAGAAHAKTEWKRKMTAGVKCKKRLCISDFCICVEVQAIFYKKGMIGQKYVSKIFFKKIRIFYVLWVLSAILLLILIRVTVALDSSFMRDVMGKVIDLYLIASVISSAVIAFATHRKRV